MIKNTLYIIVRHFMHWEREGGQEGGKADQSFTRRIEEGMKEGQERLSLLTTQVRHSPTPH